MRKINCKSDFDFILRLADCKGDPVGFPPYDWTARLWTKFKADAVTVSCIGGKTTNCFNDNGEIHVVCNSHGLAPRVLRIELAVEIPDGIYPDGSRRMVSALPLGIELVRDNTPCPAAADVELTLPYIKGDKGDPFTFADLTPGQIAELQKPAMDAVENVKADLALKQDALTPSSDLQITDNIIGLTDMAKKRLFIDMWNEACGEYGRYNEQTGFFELNGLVDISYEEAMVIYNATQSFVTCGEDVSSFLSNNGTVRTNLPFGYSQYKTAKGLFGNSAIEVANLKTHNTIPFAMERADGAFNGCQLLHKVIGVIEFRTIFIPGFYNCVALEDIYIKNISTNLNISYSPKLSLENQ